MSNIPAPLAAEPAAPRTRHALGLPAGSIRALLALAVVALLCVLILVSPRSSDGQTIPIPAYLLYLLFLVLGHFFAAHGNSISRTDSGQAPPLHLPSGAVRLLLVALLVATVAWKYSHNATDLGEQFKQSVNSLQDLPMLPVVLLGGFFLGVIIHMLVGRQRAPYWFQDLEAWVALLAFIGLGGEALLHLVINPSLNTPLDPYVWQGFVAAFITFYFGARS